MNNRAVNSQMAFLHKQWDKHIFTYAMKKGSMTLMPRPPGGDQLAHYMEYLKSRNIDIVVSLLQFHEAESLSLAHEGSECELQGIEFINFPIKDHDVPQFFIPFNQLITKLNLDINAGKNIAIHCYAGIGRTGIVASSVLIKQGKQVDFALLELSQCRGLRVPETLDQISWLHRHSQQLLEGVHDE